MFQTVVWATDGSAGADEALPFARALCETGAGRMLVVHCAEYLPPSSKGGGHFPVHVDEDEIRRRIEEQVEDLRGGDVEAEARFASASSGRAAYAVADIARDGQADVIVIGTRGHTPLGGLLLGSVAQRLLHIAPCPLLIVPAKGAA